MLWRYTDPFYTLMIFVSIIVDYNYVCVNDILFNGNPIILQQSIDTSYAQIPMLILSAFGLIIILNKEEFKK